MCTLCPLESSFCFIMIWSDLKNFKERKPKSNFILNPTTKIVRYLSLKKRKSKNKSGEIKCSKMKIERFSKQKCKWVECKSWTNSIYKIKVGGKCYKSIKNKKIVKTKMVISSCWQIWYLLKFDLCV